LKKKIVTAFPSVHDDICSYLSIQMQKKIFVQQGVRMCVTKMLCLLAIILFRVGVCFLYL
jgi:hypothetical protein